MIASSPSLFMISLITSRLLYTKVPEAPDVRGLDSTAASRVSRVASDLRASLDSGKLLPLGNAEID